MKFKISSIFLFLCFVSISTFAQTNSNNLNQEILKDEIESKNSMDLFSKNESFPVGNSIDSRFYIPGPGDVFSLKILPMMTSEKFIVVSPDNKLLLPRGFGEIDIKNKTLDSIKILIKDLVAKSLAKSEVYFSIFQTRNCLISLKGNVIYPGNYSLPSAYTVSTAIDFLNQVKISAKTNSIEASSVVKYLEREKEIYTLNSQSGFVLNTDPSHRNILIFHKDGTSTVADLLKAKVTNNQIWDPYLIEGDKIVVPALDQNNKTISVIGAVNNSGTIPFKKGDSLSFLIKCSFGLKDNVDLSNVQFIRNGEITQIEVDKNLKLLSSDLELQANDVVYFSEKTIVGNELTNSTSIVSVKGEVNKPGFFVITNNDDLKSIIQKAGGLKESASLEMSYIVKNDQNYNAFNLDSKRELIQNFQNSDLTLDDTLRFNIDQNFKRPFVSVDFNKALFGQSSEKISFQNGDAIIVGKKTKQVYVYGRVLRPGFVDFEPNKTMEWYIEKAGGYALNAHKDKTRIIRGFNKNWIESTENVSILDNDQIYVPSPPDTPENAKEARNSFYIALAGTLTSMVFVFYNIFKKN